MIIKELIYFLWQSLKTKQARRTTNQYQNVWQRFHLDFWLLILLLLLIVLGSLTLYSASNQDLSMLLKQLLRIGIAFILMVLCAQIPPKRYQQWAPYLFASSLVLLLGVIVLGRISQGAQRWLDFGLFRFQPSEIMKLAVPMMMAYYLHDKKLPPRFVSLIILGLLVMVPAMLIAKQPDLTTALMVMISGACVILLAGIPFWFIALMLLGLGLASPVFWHFMHSYQRQRVLTFLNPEQDPLGAGYHIIQSKIAIGSGGLWGKGWLAGTQSHLNFLPTHTTDFIFAVLSEERGLIGSVILITLYALILWRGLVISAMAQDTFGRLLSGSLILSFFISAYVNIGMNIGILPVAGIPLPLVSYGGTSVISLLVSFGLIMSVHTHRRLHTQ